MITERVFSEIVNAISYYVYNYVQFCNEKPKFDIKFVDSYHFNATSYRINVKTYLIEVSKVIPEELYRIYNTLFAKENENFYKTIAYEEIYNIDKANHYFDIMFDISVKAILFHEIGHIINGHLDFLYNERNKKDLHLNVSKNNLTPLESQALEMDADAFSATAIINIFTYKDNIDNMNKKYNLIKSVDHIHFIIISSLTITFGFMDLSKERSEKNNLDTLKYLPLRTRLDYFIRSSINAIDFLYGIDKNSSLVIFRQIVKQIEKYYNLFRRDIDLFSKDIFQNQNSVHELDLIHQRHVDKLEKYWLDNLVNSLLPYRYIRLYGEF